MKIIGRAVHSEVEDVIERAQRMLVLVSPYFKPWHKLTVCIERAIARGVQVVLILRGGEDRERQEEAVQRIQGRPNYVGYVERLHAKVYLSETEAIISSMNLLETSALNSEEIAVRLELAREPLEHQEVLKFCERLSRQAQQDQLRGQLAGAASSQPRPGASERHAGRAPKGSCIRCSDAIPYNPDKPLCWSCYESWAEWENPEYQEKHCHQCGRTAKTCMARPLCSRCYRA